MRITMTAEALVATAKAYAVACYSEDAKHSLGEIIALVEHCSQLFPSATRADRHMAVERLTKILPMPTEDDDHA